MKKAFRIILGFTFLITILIAPQSFAACANNEDGEAGQEGEIEYFSTDGVLRYCDNTDWVDMVDILNEYNANPVFFDGSGDFLDDASDLGAIGGSTQLTASFWIRPTGAGGSNEQIFNTSGGRINFRLRTDDTFQLLANTSAPQIVFRYQGTTTINRDEWSHVLLSFDAATTTLNVYINDVAASGSFTEQNRTIDSYESNYAIGANTSGTSSFTGDIADFWMDFGTYIDFSVEANRRDFISATGNPVFLGTDGSAPTGSAPEIFVSGPTATWHTNDGSGNGFVENGALTDGTGPVTLAYTANPVEFDGTNDYLRQTSMSHSNVTIISGSFWFKRDVNDLGTSQTIYYDRNSAGEYFRIRFNTSNKLVFDGREAVADVFRTIMFANTPIIDGQWHHINFSLDTTNRSLDQVYIDGVDDTDSAATTIAAFGAGDRVSIGAFDASTEFSGELADIWIDHGNKIDFSIEANRRDFITSDGKPVNLGTDGSTPTGSSPEVFLSGDTSTWHTNDGTFTGFTENGALTDGTSPVQLSNFVAYWKLDETSGSSITDSSGNGNTGTWEDDTDNVITTEAVTGEIDGALDFEESDSSAIQVPTGGAVDNLLEMTVCAWIKPESVPGTSYPQIVYKADSGDNGWQFYLDAGNGTGIGFTTRQYGYKTADSAAQIGVWQHVCATWDGTDSFGGIKLYVDGTEITATTDSGDFGGGTAPDDDPLFIGSAGGRPNDYFDGAIDEVKIYDSVLTIGEIIAISECSQPGEYFYNSSEDVMQWCNSGSEAINMHDPASGSGGCTSPTASEGALNYNTNRFEACDGNGWISIGK